MAETDETSESQGTILCKSCGLCCTGHLFIWAKLRSAEMDSAQALGLNVFKSDPRKRGFSQPCPLWQGQCTIYTAPHYPRFCRTYKCKLLKEVLDENTELPNALTIVQQAREMIHEVEALLPVSSIVNFRERLVAHMEYQERLQASAERGRVDQEFLVKARSLLALYADRFGVKDLIDHPEAEAE